MREKMAFLISLKIISQDVKKLLFVFFVSENFHYSSFPSLLGKDRISIVVRKRTANASNFNLRKLNS